MKNIVIFIGGYLPAKKYGGPVTSISNLTQHLGNEYNFYIITFDHDLGESQRLQGITEGWNKVGNAQVMYLNEKEFKPKRVKKILSEINADLVCLSSIMLYKMTLPVLRVAKELGIPVLLAPRGELSSAALEIRKSKKRIYLLLLKLLGVFSGVTFQATSEDELSDTNRVLNVSKNNIVFLPNMPCSIKSGVSHGTKDQGFARFVYIGRIHRIKNLLFALECLYNVKGNIIFDIYGPLQDTEYWKQCESVIARLPDNISVNYKGQLEPGNTQSVFSEYDCFLFPTTSENYGQVVAEAISSGCHVIISKGTTPWDDIDERGGYAVSLDAPELWTQRVNEVISWNSDFKTERDALLRDYAEEKLEVTSLKAMYHTVFDDLIK